MSQTPIALAVKKITEVRTPMTASGTSFLERLTAHVWSSVSLDGLILSSPSHDGQPEDVARQVYHRLTARLLGAEVHSRLSGILNWTPALAFVGAVLNAILAAVMSGQGQSGSPFNPASLILSGLPSIILGLVAAWLLWQNAPRMMAEARLEPLKAEALGAVRRCFLRAMPKEAPMDLQDMWRHGWLTSESRPLSSEIVDTDASSLTSQEVGRMWQCCIVCLAVAGLLPALIPCLGVVFAFFIPALARRFENPGVARVRELERQNAVEGSVFVAAGGLDWAQRQEMARMLQIDEATRDGSPLFTLGLTTGVLAGRGDMFAPSAGLTMTLSLKDLQNHMIVLGGTGSGKTSGILRPLAFQAGNERGLGIVVMDGKGALPSELKDIAGMKVVDPSQSVFSLVGGLSAVELVDTLADVLRPRDEKDPFWSDSAMGLLRRSAVIAKEAGGDWWTLKGVGRIAVSQEARAEASRKIERDRVLADPLLEDAFLYFADEWDKMEEKPKSSILSVARTWIATLTAHPDLLKWASTLEGQDSFDILLPLRGGRLGFLIPEHRYGRAGAAVAALLKARLYSGLKRRADGGIEEKGTGVLFIIDEAQEIATRDDATMLAIGRSLGLAFVAATQSVEGINEKLGDHAAAKWFSIFGSAVSLVGRSPATDSFMAGRVGANWRPFVSQAPGASVRDTIASDALSGAIATARNQPSMMQWLTAANEAAGGASFSKRQRGVLAAVGEADRSLVSSVTPVPFVHPQEMPFLLAEPNLALAVTTRGRVPRRDVIKLTPRF